jgi:formylglycine-generating enzyme required for sulfatase activity
MITSNTVVSNRYRVVRPIGGGAMKQVYLAEDTRLANRWCALAEMIDSFANPDAQRQAIEAFKREADILAGLSHEHIVRIYDRFSEANRHYLVMEYVQGKTLEETIHAEDGTLSESTAIGLTLQVLESFEYLHSQTPPIIYRDLKPSNIIVMPNGRVKLIDFGIARLFQPQTRGTLIGTPGYAAPEQYKGAAEPRSDLYALGAVMHFMLTGRDPSAEPPFMFPPVEKLRPDLKPALADLVGEALALEGNNRISSAAEFRRRLDRLKTGKTADPLVIATEPVLLDTAASQLQCSRCARWIPADASLCPYCGATFPTRAGFQLGDSTAQTARLGGATKPVRRIGPWTYSIVGLVILAGMVFGGIYYSQQMRAPTSVEEKAGPAAPEKAEPQAATEAVRSASEKSATPSDAAEKHQAELKEKLDQDIASLQKAKPGGARETQLREDAIATALAMNPAPTPPDEAQQELDKAKSELKVAATPIDYKAAAGTLRKALRQAPWLAEGYQALADAEEKAGNYSDAISNLKYYSLANPQASDATQVQSKIADLQQLQLKAQQAYEEQRKVRAMAASRLHTQAAANAHPTGGRTFRDCADCPEMVVVPAGSFTMGSPSSEAGRGDDEGPQHQVTIGSSFAVGKYPVTRDEYARFVEATGHSNDESVVDFPQTARDPVVAVSWDDVKAYVAWLSEKTGKNYRLLTESEYEYAERAGTSTVYWWGDSADELCRYANGGPCNHRGTVPVGTYPANAFGLNDMAGNVWEWTEDCFNESYAGAPVDGTAWTAGICSQRVARGGSWDNDGDGAWSLRSAARPPFRINDSSRYRVINFGFRVARTL